MKQVALLVMAIAALGGQAQAQIEFVAGSSSIEYNTDGGFSIVSVDTNAAYSLGNWGFQIGADASAALDAGIDFTTFSFDGHFYRQLQNDGKIGAYVNIVDAFGGVGLYDTGVEAMLSFGAFDIEASTGVFLSSGGSSDTGTFDITAFYQVSQNIKVNAGYAAIYQIGGSGYIDLLSIGASYQFSDSGIAAYVDYQTFDGGIGPDFVKIGLSWNYGRQPNNHFFDHGSAFFDGFFGFGA